MENAKLPRIRSAREAAAELKRIDPGTRIKERHIRALMCAGCIPVISVGRRKFTNLDMLIEYLIAHPSIDISDVMQAGVRKIPERMR